MVTASLADVEAKTVGKTMNNVEAEAVLDTPPDTKSEVVAKTIAYTLSCVQSEAPVKTENATVVAVEAYTDV